MRSKIHGACCAAFLTLVGALSGCVGADLEEAALDEDLGEGEAAICTGAGDSTTGLDAEEQAFLTLLNNHRQANGKAPVAACKSLSRAAQGHSEDMRNNNYFSHTGLNGSTFTGRSCNACYALGCGPQTFMGENIAAGNSTAQGTFTQWKNSSGHNANMLSSNFKVVGIGRATGGGTFGTYWTTVFGGASESSCAF